MKRLFVKRYLLVTSLVIALFSCTTKEEKIKEFVEQNVVSEAEEYLICQSIINYVQNDAVKVFTDRINYYASNPYYDYSYFEMDMVGPFLSMSSSLGATKKMFDARWDEFNKLYVMFSYDGNVEYGMHQIDTALHFRDLLKDCSYYSIEEIADFYFKPSHMKFTEITPQLYQKIYRSILCLGAATYKYDIVDEIRVKEIEKGLWSVDMVYHSGYCMNIEVGNNKEYGYYVSKAPWLPEVWGDEDDLWIDEEEPID